VINLIWAQGRNGELGLDNKLPWHLPEDLAYFKEITMGSLVVMGRKTYESIGKPLPGRGNIVLSRQPNLGQYPPEVWMYSSITKLHNDTRGRNVFVIGGKEIFERFMPFAQKLYITYIDKDYEADTFAPIVYGLQWKEESATELNEFIVAKTYIKN
jgi:dihydrofolate reductase